MKRNEINEAILACVDTQSHWDGETPDFFGDMNCMTIAICTLDDDGLEAFAENLAVEVFGHCPDCLLKYADAGKLLASGSQHMAIAFLKTKGKWRGA